MVERFLKPTSAAEALRLHAQHGGAFLAGGTELNWHGAPKAAAVVSLAGLGLDRLSVSSEAVLVGATVSLQRLVDSEELRAVGLGVLCEAAAAVGSRPIRAQATIGGNVACNKSCGDLLPSLIALDATVLLTSSAGEREVPIAELVGTPDRSALITALRIPRLGPSGRVARQRFARSANDLATVNVALALRIDGGALAEPRLAVGGVARTVVRIAAGERELVGARVDGGAGAVATLAERLAKAVAGAVEPIDDLRGSAAFKRELAGTLAGRALEACMGSRGGAR